MLNIPVQWICFLGNNFCFGTKNSVDYNSWLSGDKARGARGCCWLFGYKRCFVGDIDLFSIAMKNQLHCFTLHIIEHIESIIINRLLST